MPYGQREALTSLITMLIVLCLFTLMLTSRHAGGAFDGPDGLQNWAQLVLWLIAGSLGITIAVTIAVHIIYGIVSGEKPVDHRDERDREIERSGLTLAWYLLSFGILGVIIDLAMGASAFRALNVILALCALSEIFKNLFKLWLYRSGD